MIEFISAYPWLMVSMFAAGLAAGFAGGLFGIGGGIITVPVFYAVFSAIGAPEETSLKTAIGTSLGVIIITSVRSLLAHYREGKVDFPVLRAWAPWIAVGSAAGGVVAKWAPAELLTIVFAGGAFYVAWKRMGGARRAARAVVDLHKKRMKIPIGIGTGLFSALMGLGGGAVGVMVMTASGRSIHQAIATSAGFGVAVALPGVLGFVWSGLSAPDLPPGSLGYFHPLGFLAMAAMAAISAPFGARLAHRTDGQFLSRLFAIYVAVAALALVVDIFG